MIEPPFLLYLGHSSDPVGIKTSRGLATFRAADCLGEFRHDDCPLTLGLPRLTIAEAAARKVARRRWCWASRTPAGRWRRRWSPMPPRR
jgi:hypothetical protein